MKKVAVWGTTCVVFVIIRVMLVEVGVYSRGERVGGFLDFFIFLILLSVSQFAFSFVFKDKEQENKDDSDQTHKE